MTILNEATTIPSRKVARAWVRSLWGAAVGEVLLRLYSTESSAWDQITVGASMIP